MPKNMLWFDAYQDVVTKYGVEPDWTLMEYLPLIPQALCWI